MNKRGSLPRMPLPLCPNCGMDSGERKVIEGPVERYIVICTTCGCHTKAYTAKGAETRAWVRGAIVK